MITGRLSPGDLIAYPDLYHRDRLAHRHHGPTSMVSSRRLSVRRSGCSSCSPAVGDVELPDAGPVAAGRRRGDLRQVSFHYTSAIDVISDVSFSRQPGQIIALVGPSGAVKVHIGESYPPLLRRGRRPHHHRRPRSAPHYGEQPARANRHCAPGNDPVFRQCL